MLQINVLSASFSRDVELLECRRFLSTYFVAPTGKDTYPGTIAKPFLTVQHAVDAASRPGDFVEVRAGTYHEMLTLDHSGSADGGPITLEAYHGEKVLISGKRAISDDVGYGNVMVQIINRSYLTVKGLTLAYDSGANIGDDAFGIRIQGSGSNIVISDNLGP